MTDIERPDSGGHTGYQLPHFPTNWGPYLAYNAAITFAAFGAAAMSRTDTGAVVIGGITVAALVAGAVIAKMRR